METVEKDTDTRDTADRLQGRRQALLDVARNLGAATDLQDSLDQILLSSRDVMACEVCSILLPERKTGDMLIRSTRNETGPIRVPKGEGISGQVFMTKKPINISDAQTDSRHYRPSGAVTELITRAMLTIPLLDGDRSLGVMQAINPLDGSSFDEADEEIFEAFGGLVSVTLIRLEAQVSAIRDAERRRDLALANEIQNSFLPTPSQLVGGVRIESYYEPASEVGGDFYFWHELDDGSVLLGVGDVCGKGLAAALDMARGVTMVSAISHLATQKNLGEWVGELNGRLCSVMAPGRFIAATFALVHPDRLTISACMAGAMRPYSLQDKRWKEADVPAMPALGISGAVSYESVELDATEVEALMLSTDGLLEIREKGGRVFEDECFPALLERLAAENRLTLAEEVEKIRNEFSAEPSYHDDATILLVTPVPRPEPECVFNSCAENICAARKFVESWARFAGFEDREVGLTVLGIDEVLTNICRHAYGSGGGPVWCSADVTSSGLYLELQHEGDGICGSEIEIQKPNCEDPGGRGMHVIHTVFDDVVFEEIEGRGRYRVALTRMFSC